MSFALLLVYLTSGPQYIATGLCLLSWARTVFVTKGPVFSYIKPSRPSINNNQVYSTLVTHPYSVICQLQLPLPSTMGSLVSGAVTGLITGVSGLVTGNANDQNFRNGWTQQTLGTVTAANPKKNVIIVFPPHDQNLQGSKYQQLVCKTPT